MLSAFMQHTVKQILRNSKHHWRPHGIIVTDQSANQTLSGPKPKPEVRSSFDGWLGGQYLTDLTNTF